MKKYFLAFFLIAHITLKSSTLIIDSTTQINALLSQLPNQNGKLQQTFGNKGNGTNFLSPQIIPDSRDHLTAIIIDSENNIVCGGYSHTTSMYFSIARFLPSGLLDTSFGNSGSNYVNFPIGTSGQTNEANALLETESGYVLGGKVTNGPNYHFGIAQYTKKGFLDTSFGGRGNGTNFINTFIAGGGNNDLITNLLLQTQTQNIIATGSSNGYFALAQFLPNGQLNTTFGGNGTGYNYLNVRIAGGSTDFCATSGLQSTGKIILAGYSNGAGGGYKFALVRYTSTGILDTSFASIGYTFLPFTITGGTIDICKALAIQSDDKIILAGSSRDSNAIKHFALARFNANGTLDTSFGNNGTTYLPIIIPGGIDNEIHAIALQADGKIIAGGIGDDNLANPCFTFARFNQDGSLDLTFGNNGTLYFTYTNILNCKSIALTNNSIIGAGNDTTGDFFGICQLNNIPSSQAFKQIYAGKAGLVA